MMASTAQARTDSFVDLWKIRFEPGFLEAELKSRSDPNSLSELERERLTNFLVMFLTVFQNVYYQRSMGTLDSSQSTSIDSLPLLNIAPYYRDLIEEGTVTRGYSDEFVHHLHEVIRRTGR